MYGLLILFTILLVLSFTMNFLRNRHLSFHPELFEGEKEEFRYSSNLIYKKTERALTNRRFFFQKIAWLLNLIKLKIFHMDNSDTYLVFKTLNFLVVALAVYAIMKLPPIGFILALFSITSVFYLVILKATRKSWIAPLFIFGLQKHEAGFLKTTLQKFEQKRSGIVAQTLYGEPAPGSRHFYSAFDRTYEFNFGFGFPLAMAAYLVLAISQRLVERHIAFDDLFFAPIYLMIPILIAIHFDRKTGFFSGWLGIWMVYAIMIPFSFFPRLNDYGLNLDGSDSPWLLFIFMSLAMGLMALLGSLLGKTQPIFSLASYMLWIVFCFFFSPASLTDYHFWVGLLLSWGLLLFLSHLFSNGISGTIDRWIVKISEKKSRFAMIAILIALFILLFSGLTVKNTEIYSLSTLDDQLHNNAFGYPLSVDRSRDTLLKLRFSRDLDKRETLYLDQFPIADSSRKEFDLPVSPGVHLLEVKSEETEPMVRKLIVLEKEQRTVNIALLPRIGDLELESIPSGARVFLEGKEMGKTPLKLEGLPAGFCNVKFVYGGEYRPLEERFKVEIGKKLNAKVVLNATPGFLEVATGNGAVASVNGEVVTGRKELQPGEYQVVFTLPSAWGTPPIEKSVAIRSNQTTRTEYAFPEMGSLQIVCNPFAQIYIDGRFFKEASAASIGKIIAGLHTVTLKKQGYPDFATEVAISANSENRIVLTYNFTTKNWSRR